jgi:hypothetical protein
MQSKMFFLLLLFLDSFLWNWGLNSGLHTFKVGTISLGPNFQSALVWLIWRWGFMNLSYLLTLALNHDLHYLIIPSDKDHKHEPPAPTYNEVY